MTPADNMTGGIYMHIHSYQIYNVLNLYGQQLSRNARTEDSREPCGQADADKQESCGDGHRRIIMDTISSEIVERISQYGPQSAFNEALSNHLRNATSEYRQVDQSKAGEFTYTMIDEHNCKQTHALRLQELKPLVAGKQKGGLGNHIGALETHE
jgi:hypothetical protein